MFVQDYDFNLLIFGRNEQMCSLSRLSEKRGHGHANMENADMENADIETADMENADMENADEENADKHIEILVW